ncbi:hypothetical protein J7L49_01130 [Candidatus Bathyarchaeota archaeon]|nr:hypothetical protein [Candidatus Bathyarchaeota archaeon]
MNFPKRIYTVKEVELARKLIKNGYKHRLKMKGNKNFKQKTKEAIRLVKKAGYYNFLRTYIRCIEEINGLTQLREADATIWANKYAVKNPVDFASLLIQKANHMKDYIEGKLYFGGEAEERSVKKRIEFLKVLKKKTQDEKVKKECERLLKMWSDSTLL